MKTPQRMAIELQGLAVTICLETRKVVSRADTDQVSLEEDEMSEKTHQPDFLYVRIPPFKDNKKQLIGFL